MVVVDAAPTGETLRLLSMPEAGRWWMEKIEPIGRRITKLTGPIIQRVVGMPIPSSEVFDAGEELFRKLEHMHDLLIDPDRTSVRVVLTLERVVIKEAQRSFTYFHLYGYPTDLVIANRILPDDVGWKYFRGWYEAQQRYGPMVEQAFAPIPIRYAPYFDREVVGLDALREMGQALYAETDPRPVLSRPAVHGCPRRRPVRAQRGAALRHQGGDRALAPRRRDPDRRGSWRRNLVLPRALIDAPTLGAKFDDHVLKIRFAAPSRSSNGGGSRG